MNIIHDFKGFAMCSEFIFDPAKWPRTQVDEDFTKLGKMFNAMRSVVRVPSLDPKYKIAVLASKQVRNSRWIFLLPQFCRMECCFSIIPETVSCWCRITASLTCCMGGRTENFLLISWP